MSNKKHFFKILFLLSVMSSSLLFADIIGKVYKDFNMNGVKDSNDAPVIGISVKAICSDGNISSTSTDANGAYTLSGFTVGTKCRVEADPSSAGVGAGSNASGSAPLVDIVADGATHNISVGSAATYCQPNPDVVMAALPGYFDGRSGREEPDDYGSIFKVPTPAIGAFNADNTVNSKRSTLTEAWETGAIWGLAWKKGTEDLFVAANLKRYVPLLTGTSTESSNAGAIYIMNNINSSTSITAFVTVPNVTTAAANAHIDTRDYRQEEDTHMLQYVGRQGLGDLEISEDESKLYTINMNTKELVIIDIASKSINTVGIPNQYGADCDNNHVRPWALKVRGADVFIGSVCENKVDDDVGAVIQKYNGAIITKIAQTNTLRYLKPAAYRPEGNAVGNFMKYHNWRDNLDWDDEQSSPMLTDIEFTNRGDLVLGYTNRDAYNRENILNGDIRKMCLNADGTYTDESTDVAPTSCTSHKVTYANNLEEYFEFYRGDYIGSNYGETQHPETALGSLAMAPGEPNIIVGMIDGTDKYQPGAIGLYSNDTGDKIGAQAVIKAERVRRGGEREIYGSKAGGLGDVELLCDPAPIEIGNYVWMDINEDGIQDANEPALPNVPVTLSCGGSLMGTATTNAQGHYYFGGINNANTGTNTITTGQNCTLSIAQSDVNGKEPTTANPNGNADDIRDNDATSVGANNEISFTTTMENNHNYDFGIKPALGCVSSILFQDINADGNLNGVDTRAPAGITVTVIDAYGKNYTATTDAIGAFTLSGIPTGSITLQIDTADADIVPGTQWSNASSVIALVESTIAGNPAACTEQLFPYTLPDQEDQDPATVATCANPTSLTWEGATVSSHSIWTTPTIATPITFPTIGGTPVNVEMQITNNNDNEYLQASSGTSAAFGQPYLTLYLGDQGSAGDGDWQNSDNAGCSAHGYDLEAGESYQLEVSFSEPVILDNWRIRDVDSGDVRNGTNNWNWQDGIKVEGFADLTNASINIEAKVGSAGAGLIKDANGIIHTDPATYNGGSVATGGGSTPNATNGHIVLTSNFIPIKKLIITHIAGPDVPCQTRSALAMAGLAVCKPLKISGTVYNDKDGSKPTADCSTSDEDIDGVAVGSIEGTALNACLVDMTNKVLDTQAVNADGTYAFDRFLHPNTSYKVIITDASCVIGSIAPLATLPTDWNYEGELTAPATLDVTVDGIVTVNLISSNVEGIDFGVNKRPTSLSYERPSGLNPGSTTKVNFYTGSDSITDFITDNEETTPEKIKITQVPSGSTVYYNSVAITLNQIIDNPSLSNFSIDPDEGDVTLAFSYMSLDKACRASDISIFKASFTTLQISGSVDIDNKETATSCDGSTALFASLIDKTTEKVLSTMEIESDGSYLFDYASGVRENTTYDIVLSDTNATIGSPAPSTTLPSGCLNIDEVRTVEVNEEEVSLINFSITPLVQIGNLVWIEDDNDGDSTTGNITPVVGSIVTATEGTNTYTARTNANGQYLITVPANKTYTLTVATPSGHLPTAGSSDNTVTDTTSEENKSHDGAGTTVTVAEVNNLTLDFGFIQKSVQIGNLVWIEDDNDGDATTGNITPVVNSVVTATDGTNTYTGTTDASGKYLITVPANKTYTLTVATPSGYLPTAGSSDNTVTDTTSEENKSHDGAGTTITVAEVNNLTLDFGFIQKSVQIGNLVWIEDDNDGDATTGNITPVVGSVVTATEGTNTYIGTTDADGKYLITVPANRTYTVTVATPIGKVPTAGSNDNTVTDTTSEENKSHDGTGTTVSVTTVDNLTLDFGFKDTPIPMVKIGNLVWLEDDNDGDATTGNITPIVGSVVTATSETDTYTGTTDATGKYLITVPANRTYTVTVATPVNKIPTAGSNDNTVTDTTSENNKNHDGAGTTVTVGTVDNLTLDFGFRTPMVKIGNLVWIEDDNDGDATTGSITPVVGSLVTATSGTNTYTATTDANGKYVITVPAYRTYTVTVATPNGKVPTFGSNDNVVPDTTSEENKSHDGKGTTVIVGTTNNFTVDFGFRNKPTPVVIILPSDVSVKIGNLVWIEDDNDGDATTGNITPVVGSVVTATTGTDAYTGITDANGKYLITVPSNKTYILTVTTPTGKIPTVGSDDNAVPDTTSEENKSHDGSGTKVEVGTVDNLTLDFGFIDAVDPQMQISHDAVVANTDGITTIIDVLANDNIEVGSKVFLVNDKGELTQKIVVQEEGVWEVVDNKVHFTTETGFDGTPKPIHYLVQNKAGQNSNVAELRITTNCVCDTYTEKKPVPVLNNIGILLLMILSLLTALFFLRKEELELI